MSLPIVIPFGGNQGSKKSYFQVHIFGIFVTFCHEDGGGELSKLDILILVS